MPLFFAVFLIYFYSFPAQAFHCDNVSSSVTYNLGTVQIDSTKDNHSRVYDSLLPLRTLTGYCDVSQTGEHWIRWRSTGTHISGSTAFYVEPRYMRVFSRIMQGDGSWKDVGEDVSHGLTHTYWASDLSTDYRAQFQVSLQQVDPNSASLGYFNYQAGVVDLQYGPSIPIYITGNVTKKEGCTIDLPEQSVALPPVLDSSFHGKNTTAGSSAPFTLNFTCSANVATPYVEFSQTNMLDASRGLLGLDATSTAKGVAIQVLNQTNAYQDLTEKIAIVAQSTAGSVQLYAQYLQTGDYIEAGTLHSTLSFSVVYN